MGLDVAAAATGDHCLVQPLRFGPQPSCFAFEPAITAASPPHFAGSYARS